ncbi:hypothetical protein [Silvanigrella sp.]|jgi:hypothetical protein
MALNVEFIVPLELSNAPELLVAYSYFPPIPKEKLLLNGKNNLEEPLYPV